MYSKPLNKGNARFPFFRPIEKTNCLKERTRMIAHIWWPITLWFFWRARFVLHKWHQCCYCGRSAVYWSYWQVLFKGQRSRDGQCGRVQAYVKSGRKGYIKICCLIKVDVNPDWMRFCYLKHIFESSNAIILHLILGAVNLLQPLCRRFLSTSIAVMAHLGPLDP